MTNNQSPFQLGHPEHIVPRPTAPDTPPDPPRNRLVRLWHSPPRRAFLLALVLVVGVLLVVYLRRDGGSEAMPVKDFDLAAAALEVEPVAAWPVHELSAATVRLPGRFDIFDVDSEWLIAMGMGAMGVDYAEYADVATEQMALERFFYDSDVGLQGQVMLYVMTLALDRRATPPQFLNDLKRMRWPRGYRVVDSGVVTLDGVEAARWIIEMRDDTLGVSLTVVQFVVVNNDTRTAWILNGISPTATFEDWLAIFQAAARTLTFTPAN